jgi:8-oxo-dGTP diphosphatase
MDARVEQHRVVAAILKSENEILLCHRSAKKRWYPSVWSFPGGHVEPGEEPHAALRRELLEELGVDIGSTRHDALFRVDRPETGLCLTVWLITAWNGTPENRQVEEHDAVGWFSAAQLADLEFADESYLSVLQSVLA